MKVGDKVLFQGFKTEEWFKGRLLKDYGDSSFIVFGYHDSKPHYAEQLKPITAQI